MPSDSCPCAPFISHSESDVREAFVWRSSVLCPDSPPCFIRRTATSAIVMSSARNPSLLQVRDPQFDAAPARKTPAFAGSASPRDPRKSGPRADCSSAWREVVDGTPPSTGRKAHKPLTAWRVPRRSPMGLQMTLSRSFPSSSRSAVRKTDSKGAMPSACATVAAVRADWPAPRASVHSESHGRVE